MTACQCGSCAFAVVTRLAMEDPVYKSKASFDLRSWYMDQAGFGQSGQSRPEKPRRLA